MGQKSDVKLEVTPLPGVTVTGVTLNFTAGAIPTCVVDVAPDEKDVIKIEGGAKGILANPDKEKRKNDVQVKIEVKSKSGSGDKTRKLEWKGYFDGLTIGNTVGQNTYQAILKGKAQTLLELTLLTPGLHPTSINPYRNPLYSIIGNANAGDEQSEVAISSSEWSEGIDIRKSPIEFYKSLVDRLIQLQKGSYAKFLGSEKGTDGQKAIVKILSEPRYTKALTRAEKLWQKIDIDAVKSGTIAQLKVSQANACESMRNMVLNGPNVLLENFMNFLSFMGCTMIFGGDEKMWVVPERSFIKQEHQTPGKKKTSDKVNVANPADYNSYTYSDNGYRDIFAVIAMTETPSGGAALLAQESEPGFVGWYYDENELTEASGLLVIPNHPFFHAFPVAENNYADAKEMKNKADGGSSYYESEKKWGEDKQKEDQKKRAKEKKDKYDQALAERINNYAQTKFYQGRYGDRRGTITMDFNPKWCPATGGTLFVRETGFFIDFWVESVTHRIDMTPPAGGSAITIVNFCCGRMGTNPVGTDKDIFLGYDKGKEKQVKDAFVQDIKAE